MKKNFYILHFLLLATTCCFAQKQITNFDNNVNANALDPVYQSQIGNRMIFSAFSAATGNELWVSDGTKANTTLLKDIVPGYQSSYSADYTKAGDFLYFVANGYEVWKTDGSPSGTRKLLSSDSTMNLNIVAGKLLLTFRNVNTQRFAFAWLNADGQTDFLNEDATSFRYSGGNLYYGIHDSTSKKWTLKVFDSEARILASHIGPPLSEIIIERQNGYEYIAVDANYTERKLIVASTDRAAPPKTYDWNRGAVPLMLRDKAGALFLINDGGYFNNNVTLKIFKVIEGQNWETVADVTTSMLYAGTPTGSSEGPFHTNFVIDGDQLTFTTLFGFESIYSAYLGVFDFKKNTKRISLSLPREVTGREVKVVPQSRDVFDILYGYNKCIYNIAENKALSVEQLPFRIQKVKVANKEFELSDNVYAGSNAMRLPLVTRRKVYTSNYTSYRTVLNNKLLFWTSNIAQRTGKLWVSDGKTTSELLSHDGAVVDWRMASDSIRVGNRIVFSSFTEKAIKIFKTDGTKAGTREIYSYSNDVSAFVSKTMTNNRMAAFELNVSGKRVHLITDLENTWEIDGSQFQYHDLHATSNDFYLIHSSVKNGLGYNYIYKIENGDLKLIELNKGGADAMNEQIFDNRIYFTLRNSSGQMNDICYSDAGSDKVNRIYSGPMSYLTRRGDYLIAGTMSGPDVKIYKASTAQLLGEFADIHPVDHVAGDAVALWGFREVVVIRNDGILTRKFSDEIEFMNPVPQGILIRVKSNAGGSWYLYDLKRAKITEMFKDKPVDFNMAGAGDQLFFVDSNDRHHIAWDISDERRIDFPAGLFVAKSLSGDLALASDYTGATPLGVYSLEGNTPVKKYSLTGDFDLFSVSEPSHLATSSPATGYELARIDRDSLFRFPEIIRGSEGIILQEAFRFNGSVYATAFTFSKGLQVWKMDELNLVPDQDDELVVTRPEMPDRGSYLPDDAMLNAYPNPVINELNIDLKEGGLIRILDPKGYEQLKTVVGKSKRLDVKSLPAGQYIIIYSGANGHVVKKIVKL
jgi:ELWxxDGT repeat protein